MNKRGLLIFSNLCSMLNRIGLFVVISLFFSFNIFSQNSFHCIVKDSSSNESIPGASVILNETTNGTITDISGNAVLKNIPNGAQTIVFSFVGYKTAKRTYIFPITDSAKIVTIQLSSQEDQLEEIIVSSTRTNSRIDDLPVKVEVLGQEDMDEESTIVPGNITSILGDLSIITIQRTNPVNGNDAIRMQGLDPRYTQLMRDGLPLYGGFSGSLGVLSIPPLDLKQVEIIKGSASTLYGGGAIGGLINFISKTPFDSAQTILTGNITTLKEGNFNGFVSRKWKKTGFTFFGGTNTKTPVDINKDGFTEVPRDESFTIHPKFFYYPTNRSTLVLGFSSVLNNRTGGDIHAILFGIDSAHTFVQREKTFRNTGDVNYSTQLNESNSLTFKSAVGSFQRDLNYSGFIFSGSQYSSYSEINDLIKRKKHTIVAGLNFVSELFRKNKSDTVLFDNYTYYTVGSFLQDDWQIAEKISVQAGLRFDVHNKYGNFVLPRISFFYKPTQKFSIRFAGGTGYKVPNLFDFASPSASLINIPSAVKGETSFGLNTDINYHTILFEKISFQIDQAFYITHINDPVILTSNTLGQQTLSTGNYYVNSYGTDTYIRLKYHDVELYVGYNHTESLQENSGTTVNMPFNPKDKFSTTLTYSFEGKWRMGAEVSYTANQFIYGNQLVNNFLFMAAMVERKFRKCSLVLNCENLLDSRQSKFEKIVEGTTINPIFKPVWAPLEGRVVNLSFKITL